LSYAWGDPTVTETIFVDDEPFQVTTNLAAFLTTLNRGRAKWGWSLDSPLHFWVDAICINQANILERSEQVLHMGEIYKTATRVLIWLGPYSIHTEQAFDRLLEIEEEVTKLTKAPNSASYGQLTELAQRLVDDNIPKDLDIGVEMSIREGLKDVIGRAWWRRTWILQEISAHDKPTFFCGEFACSKSAFLLYQTLASVSAVNSGADAITRTAAIDYACVSTALYMQRKMENAQSSSLLQLLQATRFSDATDPRDKIYGILGLSWDFSSGSELVPDYNLTAREVYTGVVKAHMKKHDNLDIFGHCGYTAGGLDLPSWVPDWRSASETLTGVPFEKEVAYKGRKVQPVYHASGEILSFGDQSPVITDKELYLHGLILDAIETLYKSSDYTDPSRRNVEKSWLTEDKAELYTLTGETMERAYLRTIVADFHVFPSQGAGYRQRGYAMIWPEGEGEVSGPQSEDVRFAQYELMRACHKRRFAYTRGGWMGLVPEAAQAGDSVAAILGGQVLYILRSSGARTGRFQLVGEAYFHGMMDGEAMKMVDRGERAIKEIVLE
jgi:hypothetical protein